MSAIASFIQLPKTALEGLRQATTQGSYQGYLQQHGRAAADYEWSGYILATLLPYLEEQHQIDLMRSEHDDLAAFLTERQQATHFIFTHAHRQSFHSRLDPQAFSAESLRDYYNEFNESDEPDVGQPMLDGVRAVRQCLGALDEGSVIVFSIG
jgi:hypothetical protein